MSESRAVAVMGKLTFVDCDRAAGVVVPKQALLIIMEIVVVEGQIAGLISNSCAVAVRHLCPGKRKSVDNDITVGNENAFAVWYLLRGDHVHHAANPLECYVRV